MPSQLPTKTSYAFLRMQASVPFTHRHRRRRLRSRALRNHDSGLHAQPLATHQPSDQAPQNQRRSRDDRRRQNLPQIPHSRIVPPNHRSSFPHSLPRPPLDREGMFLMFDRTWPLPAKIRILRDRPPSPAHATIPVHLQPRGLPCRNGPTNRPRIKEVSH